jgi:hypothetical protein
LRIFHEGRVYEHPPIRRRICVPTRRAKLYEGNMNPLLIASLLSGAVAASVAGWGMYELQEGRYARKELDHVQQHAEETREALTMERKRAEGVRAAQDEGTRRLSALRADANRARDAVDGLRDATTAVLKHADTSLQACTVAAGTLGTVFNQCSAAYQGMAEAADGHSSDAMTLDAAWPK